MPKKKTALTIEERLQQALVPANEQPYDVPENWVWCRLGSVATWGSGGTPSRKHNEYYNGNILWIKTGELNNAWIFDTEEKITNEGLNNSSAKLFPVNTVLIAMYGATIGKVAILGVPATTNQACACAVCNSNLQYKFLFFYCISQKNIFIEKGKGGAQPNISQIILKQHPIPLPPLAEQKRIVDRIEELFAKLDEAKEKLQEVVDGFAVRKAAILHKAFTGELTKKWREENGVSDDSWEDVSLDSVCKSIFDGDHMPPPKSETGIPFLVISNVNTGYLSFEKCRFVPEQYYNALSKTRTPEKGDILYTIVGSYGIPVLVDTDEEFCFQRHMALLKPKNIFNRFLWYQLQTQKFFEKATSIATGTAQLTVPIKGLRKLSINSPTLPEQHEIVRLLDALLARERKAQQAASEALTNIELMKKSILARAFRGELGTNREEEESALVLLKEVLQEENLPK